MNSPTWEAVMRWVEAGRALMDASFGGPVKNSRPSGGKQWGVVTW